MGNKNSQSKDARQEEVPPEQDPAPPKGRSRVVSAKWLVSIETALALAIGVIAVPATFFATRADLGARIKTLESELEVRFKYRNEMDRGVFNVQRNHLNLLADLVQRARAEVNDTRPVEITWEPMRITPGMPPMAPEWANLEVIKTVTPSVCAVDCSTLREALGEPRFLGIDDAALIRATSNLSRVLSRYYVAVARAGGLSPTVGMMLPDLRPGMYRYTVEFEIQSINDARKEVKSVLDGFGFEAAIAAEVARINGILKDGAS